MADSTTKRLFQANDYSVAVVGGGVVVLGPDSAVARAAEKRLAELLATVEGCTLLGRFLNGRSTMERQDAKEELCRRLGLPPPVEEGPAEEQTASLAGVPADYDEAHDRIVALRLPDICTRTITELHGICHAILADGRVSDPEIELIRGWLAGINPEFHQAWPISELRQTMERVLADRVVTDQERRELQTFLGSLDADPAKAGVVSTDLCDANPRIEFAGKKFLLTGRLSLCTRAKAFKMIEARGGTVAKSPGRSVDYLVIGDLGNEAYQYSRYGRKIEAMKELRQAGHHVQFVAEKDFVAAVGKPE